jgi:hypothetical protein
MTSLSELPNRITQKSSAIASQQSNVVVQNAVKNLQHFGILVLSTVLFAITSWYAHLSLDPSEYSKMRRSVSVRPISNLAVLRILQEATSACASMLLFRTLSLLQWTMIASYEGVRLATVLSLAPSTAAVGLSRYLYNPIFTLFERLTASTRYVSLFTTYCDISAKAYEVIDGFCYYASSEFGFIQ